MSKEEVSTSHQSGIAWIRLFSKNITFVLCFLQWEFRFPLLFFSKGDITIFKELLTNDQIRAPEVRLVGAEGEQLGIIALRDAQKIADDEGLDLVLMTATATPPVCKLMNYGKYKYEQTKKEKELKKNQKIVELKEIQLSLTIDKNDINYRIKQGQKFLSEGNKVKITLRMKGRQQAFVVNALNVVKDFALQLAEFGSPDKDPEVNGRNIIMIVNPKNK